MLNLGVTGAVEMRYVAGLLRKAAVRDLKLEMRKGQRDAFKPLQTAVREEAVKSLPSGYGPLMAKAVKVTVRTGAGATAYTVRIFARGKRELRDVRAINNGNLRHPFFGSRRKGHWFDQRVRPGFVTRPVQDTWDRVMDESVDAVERVMTRIARG